MSNYIGNSPGVGQDQLFVYSPASGATTLSGADLRGISLAYTIGEPFVEVQVNGTILAPSDYTATTGNTIVLTSGSFNAGDLVVVRARSALSLANTYTQSAADALLALKADLPGVWTTSAFSSITASVGTITGASSVLKYKKIGSVCFISTVVSITNNGTGSGTLNLNGMPYAAAGPNHAMFHGRENGVSGKSLHGIVAAGATTMAVFDYANIYPAATNAQIIMAGSYEIAP
jgi:hypothetical protein